MAKFFQFLLPLSQLGLSLSMGLFFNAKVVLEDLYIVMQGIESLF